MALNDIDKAQIALKSVEIIIAHGSVKQKEDWKPKAQEVYNFATGQLGDKPQSEVGKKTSGGQSRKRSAK